MTHNSKHKKDCPKLHTCKEAAYHKCTCPEKTMEERLEEWYQKLELISGMVYQDHQDFQIEKELADLWFTLAQMKIWQFFRIICRTKKLETVILLHKDCCGLSIDKIKGV